MSLWSSVLTPGLVAAGVTLLTYSWLQRPRADLRMARINTTMADAERLFRARQEVASEQAMLHKLGQPLVSHWQPVYVVRLTNYGDGTAYDIRLSGSDCRPRVWVDDMGLAATPGEPPTLSSPMWRDALGALEPGESVSVIVMCNPGPPLPKPVLKVSWPRLPRRGLGRKTRQYDLGKAGIIETGWPGKYG